MDKWQLINILLIIGLFFLFTKGDICHLLTPLPFAFFPINL